MPAEGLCPRWLTYMRQREQFLRRGEKRERGGTELIGTA